MVWFLRLWFLAWFSFILVPRCLLAPFTCFETHWIFKFSFFLDFALKLLKSDSPRWETEWSDFFRLNKFNYQQWASWSSTCVDDRYSILQRGQDRFCLKVWTTPPTGGQLATAKSNSTAESARSSLIWNKHVRTCLYTVRMESWQISIVPWCVNSRHSVHPGCHDHSRAN
jgi:hypothetical protein